ncbi:hypothetical protein JXA47_03960 [Candidatus Sumerlaeota bacterium]|nr:hypothetical protein [Candidatus Sumerlaeota bacterium]
MRICFVMSALLLVFPAAVFANVFAAHLEVSDTLFDPTGGDLEITYRLNEDATSVNIEIFAESDPGTVLRTLTGGTTSGEQIVLWDGTDGSTQVPDGNYSFRIIAEDTVGHGPVSWEVINDTASDLQQHFYSPRGLAVQTDQTSPYFGTIYISDTYPGLTASGRTTSVGIYAVGNDGSDIFGQGDVPATGGVAWPVALGPYELTLDEEGSVWMADWSDTHSGVWKAPGNLLGSWPAMLTEANRDGSGVCDNHGSISGLQVEGSGASTVLYTRDEDYSVGAEAAGSVLSYAIGTLTAYADPPTLVADDAGYTVNDTAADFVRDVNGDWWLSQYRWDQASSSPHLWRVDGTTGLVTHNSFDDGSLLGEVASTYGGICINPAGDTLYLAGYGNQEGISIFDIATTSVTGRIATTWLGVGNANRKIALDAAGNLLIINSSSELLFVLSPPDGSNSFTTTYHTTFEVGEVTAVESPELYR